MKILSTWFLGALLALGLPAQAQQTSGGVRSENSSAAKRGDPAKKKPLPAKPKAKAAQKGSDSSLGSAERQKLLSKRAATKGKASEAKKNDVKKKPVRS